MYWLILIGSLVACSLSIYLVNYFDDSGFSGTLSPLFTVLSLIFGGVFMGCFCVGCMEYCSAPTVHERNNLCKYNFPTIKKLEVSCEKEPITCSDSKYVKLDDLDTYRHYLRPIEMFNKNLKETKRKKSNWFYKSVIPDEVLKLEPIDVSGCVCF